VASCDHPPASQPLPTNAAGAAAQTRLSEERFVPETMPGLIRAEHEGRYRWAGSAVAGREVLDAGCGVGYGAEILAEAGAARIVGLDVSPEAVQDATLRADSIGEFVLGDLERLPFAPRSFDVVVCFEVIEHVRRRELALDELRRVLRSGGVLIVSSPNRNVYLPGNPHHVHEYTPSELHAALTKRFGHVTLYRQHQWISSLVTDDAGLQTESSGVEIAASVRKVAGVAPGEEVYTLAVAAEGPLPVMAATAILADAIDLRWWHDKVAALEHELDALQNSMSWRATAPLRSAKQRSSNWRVGSPLRSARRRLSKRGSPEAT
jgi:ubiquinone/menaquinone biosynthesis C-methylase UbiE